MKMIPYTNGITKAFEEVKKPQYRMKATAKQMLTYYEMIERMHPEAEIIYRLDGVVMTKEKFIKTIKENEQKRLEKMIAAK